MKPARDLVGMWLGGPVGCAEPVMVFAIEGLSDLAHAAVSVTVRRSSIRLSRLQHLHVRFPPAP